jgi:hypothetical protein
MAIALAILWIVIVGHAAVASAFWTLFAQRRFFDLYERATGIHLVDPLSWEGMSWDASHIGSTARREIARVRHGPIPDDPALLAARREWVKREAITAAIFIGGMVVLIIGAALYGHI